MAITETKKHQVFRNGVLQSEQSVVTDITAQAIATDIDTKVRAVLAANATYLSVASPSNAQVVAQVARLTRTVNALIRLLKTDLLVESTDT